jgi:DNA repair protein RadA/Sms
MRRLTAKVIDELTAQLGGERPSRAQCEAWLSTGSLDMKGNGTGASLVCLSDVKTEKVRWLFFPYIPEGKQTLLEGDPGEMKSYAALAIGTGVSLGKLPGMPDFEPQTVLICSAEDGLSDTIRPRLDSMGADLTRIHAVKGALDFGNGGLVILEQYIEQIRPLLVVVDPLVAYLGAKLDMHRSNETRVIGTALAEIAEKHSCSILSIRHLTKDTKQRPLYRGLGSIDLLASVRSVLLAGHDPDNPQRRALIHLKSNLAPLGKSIGYSLTDDIFAWTGESSLTAERIMGISHKDFRRIEAESRIINAVSSLEVADVDMVAERAGIAPITAQYHLQRMRENKQLDFKLVPVGKTKKILYSIPKNAVKDSLQVISSISSIPLNTISTNNTEDTNNSNDIKDIKEKENDINDIKCNDTIEVTNTDTSEVKNLTKPYFSEVENLIKPNVSETKDLTKLNLSKEVASDVIPVAGFKFLGNQSESAFKCKDGVNYCSLQSKYTKQPFSCGYTPGNSCPSWSKANE